MLELKRNPPLDAPLEDALIRIWTDVTNAGGAVGFVAPVSEDEVRPLAAATFGRVREGREDLVVGFDDGEPVAFGFLVPNADALSRHWATIKRLQRDPKRRGAAVGAAVLAELETLAGERGFEFVVLTVRGGTGRVQFYAGLGYRLVATLPRWLKVAPDDWRDSLVLAKPVDPAGSAALTLAVRRLDPDLPLPAYAHPGDAGLDLLARESVTLPPGERAVVPTGVAVAIPAGHVGLVHPRSGLAARHGLTLVNAPGTIDAGYRGEIKVIVANLDAREPVTLARGDRIAQLVIQRVATVHVQEVAELPPSARGAGGFGSTGR